MVFLLLLVYVGTVAYISVEISLGSIATFYDYVCMVWYAIVEWPLFDAPSSTNGVFTS